MENRKLTSESVTEGHPDKICDIISDSVLDFCLKYDPYSRVACECAIKNKTLFIFGEITTKAPIMEEVQSIAKNTLDEIGYDGLSFKVVTEISIQSPDIAMGVDVGGAGDQGFTVGFACNETPKLMPLSISLAHKLTKQLTFIRKNLPVGRYLKPDGKAQVTVEYDEMNRPFRIDTILISTSHTENIDQEGIRKIVETHVINEVVPQELIDENTKILVNPTGRFVICGPEGDSGLTGRKIVVDNYGCHSRVGGGAFSGKDCSKVDRSAAYMARHIAKSIVGSGLAPKCEVQLAYAIGVAEPVSIYVDTFGHGEITEQFIRDNFDLTPEGIIKTFNLRRPIYKQTAKNGHFGHGSFPWENVQILL